MAIETFELVLLAVSSLFYLGIIGILGLFYRSLERNGGFATPDRRRRARILFGVGALGLFLGFEFLIVAVTFDISVAAFGGMGLLYAGIGGVFVASVPLFVGLVLAMYAPKADTREKPHTRWDRIGQALAAIGTLTFFVGALSLVTDVIPAGVNTFLGDGTVGTVPGEISLLVTLVGIGLVILTRWVAAKYSSYDVEFWGSTK